MLLLPVVGASVDWLGLGGGLLCEGACATAMPLAPKQINASTAVRVVIDLPLVGSTAGECAVTAAVRPSVGQYKVCQITPTAPSGVGCDRVNKLWLNREHA